MKIIDIQKYSKILYLTTCVLIITLGISGLDYSYSQPTPPTTSENQIDQQVQNSSLSSTQNQFNEVPIQQSINWNQSLIIDPTNVFCNDAKECGGIVEVAFESNSTIVPELYNSYHVFKVADMIKNLSGFQIVDVSTTPQDGNIKYLVVLSK